MRTPIALFAGCLAMPLAACGAQASREGAQSPDTVPTPGSVSPDASALGPGASGGATSTTTLGDAGEPQGVKLAELHPTMSTSASSTPPPKPAHTHDAGRGPSDIRAIIVAHRDEARACYEKALADHPGIEGDLTITWTIDPKGNALQTSLDSSRSQITEPTVVACISEIVKKIQFAPSPGGFETKASYPFNFHPRHGKATP